MTEKQKRKQPFRVNATLSEMHSDYLDKKSEEMGVTKSSLVSIAVHEWIQNEQDKDKYMKQLYEEYLKKKIEKVEN